MKVEVILPEGYEAANVSVKNGCLSYELKPKECEGKIYPKNGDICVEGFINKYGCFEWVFIYKSEDKGRVYDYACVITKADDYNLGCVSFDGISTVPTDYRRFATEEEKQRLFDALAKEGKMWDAEKKEVVRWRAGNDSTYYYYVDIDGHIECGYDISSTDADMYKAGNYFYSEELAKESPIYKAYER